MRGARWLPFMLLAACASSRMAGLAGELETAETQQLRLTSELASLSAQDRAPNCARACPLQAQICALAERICDLTRSDPPDPRCQQARTRCLSARERVTRASCVCPQS